MKKDDNIVHLGSHRDASPQRFRFGVKPHITKTDQGTQPPIKKIEEGVSGIALTEKRKAHDKRLRAKGKLLPASPLHPDHPEHRPANGAGWGGPRAGYVPMRNRPQHAGMSDREIVQILKDNLLTIATTDEYGSNRIRASEALLSRIEGAPVQRNVNVESDNFALLDDDALIRRREELERTLGVAEKRRG